MTKLLHAISKKADGNMSFRYGTASDVARNRIKFLSRQGISIDDCVAMSLQDETSCMVVSQEHKGRGMRQRDGVEADCLITQEKNIFLFLFVADCLPVTIHDERNTVVALAHLTRHNAGKDFIKKIITTIIQQTKITPDDLLVHIGPGIHKESYLHPQSIPQASEPNWQPFITNMPDGHVSLDLVGITTTYLTQNGVRPDQIQVSEVDTAKSSDYFSHYHDSRAHIPEGRFAVVAGIL